MHRCLVHCAVLHNNFCVCIFAIGTKYRFILTFDNLLGFQYIFAHHDQDTHQLQSRFRRASQTVLGLSERLRDDGIETVLDRYVESGSPVEGWPRWMLNSLDASSHVLCACTESYYRRFRGHEEPGKGKGVDWEGAVITQMLYDARHVSSKFILVLFDPADERYIPEPLRPQTHYVLDSEAGYIPACRIAARCDGSGGQCLGMVFK